MSWGALAGGLAGGLISAGGSLWSSKKNREASNQQNMLQYDLARNAIKYRVQDAKNAGIHPIYALGGQSMGSTVSMPQQDNPMRDLGQAISSYRQPKKQLEEVQALQFQGLQEDLQHKRLQNDLLRQEYNKNKVIGDKFVTPDYVKDAKESIAWLKKNGKFDTRYPTHQMLKDVAEGKILPSSITEDIGGDIGQEVHGGVNMIKSLFK